MFSMLTSDESLARLHSSRNGLDEAIVDVRRKEYGWNELPRKERSLMLLFLRQFQNILIYILFAALGLSLLLPFLEGQGWTAENAVDAGAILVIVLFNAVLGFVQEYKAEQAISALEKLTSPLSRVRRDGKERMIPSRELVPGDIVIVEAGDRISADGRIILESHLQTNESSLTGESETVDKTSDTGERSMMFAGTIVTRGSGEMVVTAIGIATEIGKIAQLVSGTEMPRTPLAKRMDQLSRMLGTVVLGLAGIIIAVSLFQGRPLLSIILTGATLAVSAVPEGLPAVVTASLAMGVRHMAKKKALVRRLDALETLGSVTVICADKTGTITENKMTVTDIWTVKDADRELLIQAAASCNRAQLPHIGDPTEIGLLEYAAANDVERLPIEKEEVPFSSEEKYMQTKHAGLSFLKGAPEKIALLCALTTDHPLFEHNDAFAEKGLRVLGIAVIENGKTPRFLGLIAMEDPPRAGVAGALKEALAAGIRTVMITGDNLITAMSIAKRIGITGEGVEGKPIDAWSAEMLREKVKTVAVYARVTPEHKIRICRALQENGEVVAMSGDGVNDAPALKGANVGVAMGKVGTDVSREAASMVLADDDYATIVTAIREGRRIYDNIRKFVLYLVRANFDEILLILVSMLMGIPLPLLPIHILWINLMTDSLPALALSVEPAEPDIMHRPPRPVTQSLFSGQTGMLTLAVLCSFFLAFCTYLVILKATGDVASARTVALTLTIVIELLFAYSARSNKPFWTYSPIGNPWMLGALAVPALLHVCILSFAPLRNLFELAPLSTAHIGWIIFPALIGFFILELAKILSLRRVSQPAF
jgi:P-type Ca2+ transporter type 2C